MQHFEITLKNEKIRTYILLSWIIIFLHITVFIALAIFSNNNVIRGTCITSLVVFLLMFVLRSVIKDPSLRPGFYVFFIMLMVSWLLMRQYWMIAIPFVFDLLHILNVRKLVVRVSRENILYPSVPVKKMRWADLANVLLKDGLLTIDSKNNKLIQYVIDEDMTAVNEKEFNDFCKRQLSQIRHEVI